MKRAAIIGIVTIVCLLGCVSSNRQPTGNLIRPWSGCRFHYLGGCRFSVEARGGRWSSYLKPGWDHGPTLDEMALVGAAEIARRYHRASFEILKEERKAIWWLGLLGYRRTAVHRLVIRLAGPLGGEEVQQILSTLGPEVGYEPYR